MSPATTKTKSSASCTSSTPSLEYSPSDVPSNNPHYIFTHDIVRNTRTLHCQIITNEPPSFDRDLPIAMRGYFGIMSSSDSSAVDLHGNGEEVHLENKHCLWQPKSLCDKEPLWHLRVQVLKDQEGRGDCPSRKFAFKSLEHLTHAANQLEAAFSDTYDITMKKCGVETPNAMGDRVNDGRCENITIDFDSETARQGWSEFLLKLKGLEEEWENEGRHEGQCVL